MSKTTFALGVRCSRENDLAVREYKSYDGQDVLLLSDGVRVEHVLTADEADDLASALRLVAKRVRHNQRLARIAAKKNRRSR